MVSELSILSSPGRFQLKINSKWLKMSKLLSELFAYTKLTFNAFTF